jgi:hypothetical protein
MNHPFLKLTKVESLAILYRREQARKIEVAFSNFSPYTTPPPSIPLASIDCLISYLLVLSFFYLFYYLNRLGAKTQTGRAGKPREPCNELANRGSMSRWATVLQLIVTEEYMELHGIIGMIVIKVWISFFKLYIFEILMFLMGHKCRTQTIGSFVSPPADLISIRPLCDSCLSP